MLPLLGLQDEKEMEEQLRLVLGEGCPSPLEVGATARVAVAFFEHVVIPRIAISSEGHIAVPEYFTIRMRGSERIYRLLSNPQLFLSLPLILQKTILDLLHLVMIRGTCKFGVAAACFPNPRRASLTTTPRPTLHTITRRRRCSLPVPRSDRSAWCRPVPDADSFKSSRAY